MVEWKDLVKGQSKWDQYEHIPIERVLGKNFTVVEYELFQSGSFNSEGIRILLSDDLGVKKFIITFASVIVKAFKDCPDKIEALIKEKVPMCIIEVTGAGGKKYYTFQ